MFSFLDMWLAKEDVLEGERISSVLFLGPKLSWDDYQQSHVLDRAHHARAWLGHPVVPGMASGYVFSRQQQRHTTQNKNVSFGIKKTHKNTKKKSDPKLCRAAVTSSDGHRSLASCCGLKKPRKYSRM